jgi:methylated-DNA-[protein]-cysteine S-methyltransferase
MITEIYTSTLETPIGLLRITGTERGIASVEFTEEKIKTDAKQSLSMLQCIEQLQEYFDGKRKQFHNLPLAIQGTEFQQDVWDRISEVGFGQTTTYGAIAKDMKLNGGFQAVGSAVGRNRLCILIPCHRIVPSTGEGFGDYAYGAEKKEWLLRHEGVK